MKTKEQLKKEQDKLEILKAIFMNEDEDHLRNITFEQYLERIGKENLGKQVDEPEEVEKKLTKEQQKELSLFEEALSSGYLGSLDEWRKLK